MSLMTVLIKEFRSFQETVVASWLVSPTIHCIKVKQKMMSLFGNASQLGHIAGAREAVLCRGCCGGEGG